MIGAIINKSLKIGISLLLLLFSQFNFAQQPKLVLPLGHKSSVYTVAYSPDGNRIVTASGDNTAKVWDVQTGYLLLDLQGHTKRVISAVFSPDGKKILTASNDETAKIWDAESGSLLLNLSAHTWWINVAKFSPDGKKVITASQDKTVKIWDAEKGTILFDLAEHQAAVVSIDISADGKKLLTAAEDGIVKIWNTESGARLLEINATKAVLRSANFNYPATKIITSSADSTAKIWDAESGNLMFNLHGHTGIVTAAKFFRYYASDSSVFEKVVTISDNSAKIWEANTGNLLFSLDGHTAEINSTQISPDNKLLLTAANDGLSKIWDIQTGKLIADLKANQLGVFDAAFSPTGNTIATASTNNKAIIWDAKTKKLWVELKGHSAGINAVEFSPDGKKIVTASDDNTAKIWDIETGKLIKILKGHLYAVNKAKFSPDGLRIVTASQDNTAKIWDATNGKVLFNLTGHTAWVMSANYSKDAGKIVTASYDSTIKIWNANTGKLIKTIKVYDEGSDGLNDASFSPDGRKIVTASDGNRINIYSAKTGKRLRDFKKLMFSAWVKAVSYSPDGNRLIVAMGNRASVWDAKTAKKLFYTPKHKSWINSANFSPDGNKIITTSNDNTAIVCSADSGKLLFTLMGHVYLVNDAQFSADGKRIVTASTDNTTKIWDAKTGRLLYSMISIDSSDYLVYDTAYRYDGSDSARKMLYITCGTEIIELNQLKDLLWEPGLVGKIMGLNAEPIKAKKLDEINICSSTPVIKLISNSLGKMQFHIIRRSAGIGDISVYINQKEVDKISNSTLHFVANEATVNVNIDKYKKYYINGIKNALHLEAHTANLDVSAKGVSVEINEIASPLMVPNLYALVVGISNYKGDKLDLKFAAKDAVDFSNTLQASAAKLFNIDGKEHVFIKTLVSDSKTVPSKSNIAAAFEQIKKSAKANDFVVVYLSGHGENFGAMAANFYYLTEDASSFDLSGVENDVAVSTNEIADWLKEIPAGKQVLIIDACASGKLAEDITFAMRAAIPSDQIRALDRLNSRTGTFVLCGAAANQSAYETSIYGQGLLTYSLLYGIKSTTALREKQFIDIDILFQYSADKVKELAAGIGGIQEPVISKPKGGASFDIGKVDDTVAENIILSLPKPIFTNAHFTNRETDDDNMGIETAVDKLLNDYAGKGRDSKVVFTEKSQMAESYKLVGSYNLVNNLISITVRVKKGNIEIQKIEINNFENNPAKLAQEILNKVDWAMVR
jgi:WD40 repeat protein